MAILEDPAARGHSLLFSFLTLISYYPSTYIPTKFDAMQCNLSLKIFRFHLICRCLRPFLNAASAMRHRLMFP